MSTESATDVRQFSTGSVRGSISSKPRFDLNSPIAARAVALVNAYGQAKYAPRNWEKGQPLVEGPVGSLQRHLDSWLQGEELDPESGLPHLWHVAWNAEALVHLSEEVKAGHLPKSLDDRPLGGKPWGVEIPQIPSAAPTATPACGPNQGWCVEHSRCEDNWW